MWRIVILTALIFCFQGLVFRLRLVEDGNPTCFFESMKQGQKYVFELSIMQNEKAVVSIMRQTNHQWKTIFTKTIQNSLKLQKFADLQGTFMFCVSHMSGQDESDILYARVKIETGLQLGEFQNLPNLNDQQNLHRQIQWMQQQKNKVFEAVKYGDRLRYSTQQLSEMTNKSYIIWAVIGILSIVGINIFFYRQTTKTLKDRKLI